jgi:hypothetical protein
MNVIMYLNPIKLIFYTLVQVKLLLEMDPALLLLVQSPLNCIRVHATKLELLVIQDLQQKNCHLKG